MGRQRTRLKGQRNPLVTDARARRAGYWGGCRGPRGGQKNTQADLLDETEREHGSPHGCSRTCRPQVDCAWPFCLNDARKSFAPEDGKP